MKAPGADGHEELGPLELMRMHVETLFVTEGPNGIRGKTPDENVPAMFLGRTVSGDVLRFRRDVDVRADLASIAARESSLRTIAPEASVDAYTAMVPGARVRWNVCYVFPPVIAELQGAVRVNAANARMLDANFPGLALELSVRAPCFASVVDGTFVSVCSIAAASDAAAEAAVETAPEHRGGGHAPLAVAAWARAIRQGGRTPLYSAAWENTSSRRVAEKLGLIPYGVTLSLDL